MSRRAHSPTDDFAGLVQRFFAEYLAAQRNLSPHTRLSYRNTFRLLLHFLAEQHSRSVDQLTLGALSLTLELSRESAVIKVTFGEGKPRDFDLAKDRHIAPADVEEYMGRRSLELVRAAYKAAPW